MSRHDIEPYEQVDLAAVAADDLLVEEILSGRCNRDDPMVDLLAGWRAETTAETPVAPTTPHLAAVRRPAQRKRSVRVGAVLVGVGMLATSGVGQAVADDPVAPLRYVVTKGVQFGAGLGSPEPADRSRVGRGAGALYGTIPPGQSPLDHEPAARHATQDSAPDQASDNPRTSGPKKAPSSAAAPPASGVRSSEGPAEPRKSKKSEASATGTQKKSKAKQSEESAEGKDDTRAPGEAGADRKPGRQADQPEDRRTRDHPAKPKPEPKPGAVESPPPPQDPETAPTDPPAAEQPDTDEPEAGTPDDEQSDAGEPDVETPEADEPEVSRRVEPSLAPTAP